MKKKFLLLFAIIMVAVCCFSLVACKPTLVKIGVQSGTTGELYVKGDEGTGFEGFSNLEVAAFNNAGLAVNALKNGQVKYVILDDMPAKTIVANVSGIKLIDVNLSDESYAFAVNKTDAALLASINAFMAKIAADGTLSGIINKYFTASETVTGISASTTVDPSKNQLVVATNAAFAPFEYKIGDKFAGIDMEIASLIAADMGVELVIKDMDFDSVVSSIGKNNIDIGMAGLTITQEREVSVNFATSYYNASQKVICLADDTTFDGLTTKEQIDAILKGLK